MDGKNLSVFVETTFVLVEYSVMKMEQISYK